MREWHPKTPHTWCGVYNYILISYGTGIANGSLEQSWANLSQSLPRVTPNPTLRLSTFDLCTIWAFSASKHILLYKWLPNSNTLHLSIYHNPDTYRYNQYSVHVIGQGSGVCIYSHDTWAYMRMLYSCHAYLVILLWHHILNKPTLGSLGVP